MYATDTILTFGFPIGRLGGARFRVSFLFPVAAMAVIWRFHAAGQSWPQSVQFGLLATGILLFSVLVHELAHLVVARSTGGEMDEIKLWPLGGLEEPYGRGYWQDHVQTMLAGPVTNLLLCLSCLLTLPIDQAATLLNPWNMFTVGNSELLVTTACRMAFLINLTLFLVNLLPITPFDGGVLLRTYLTSRFAEIEGRDLMVRLGLIFGMLGLLIGFVLGFASVVAVSAVVLILHLHENARWYEHFDQSDELSDIGVPGSMSDDFSDSFSMREDFFFQETDETSEHAEVLDRWRIQRDQEQRNLEQEERRREEELVDSILEKLHRHGRESLSSHDLHLLNRVSDRYRDRQQHS
ncbi:MAG: site-2 protease family protein [Fuerstiella sp.]